MRQKRLRHPQIFRRRDLQIAVVALDDEDRLADSLDEARIVRAKKAVLRRLLVGACQNLTAKSLRRLHLPETCTRRRRLDAPVLADDLDRVLRAHGGDGGALLTRRSDDRLDSSKAHQRASRIVHEHNVGICGDMRHAVRDRILALGAALSDAPGLQAPHPGEKLLHGCDFIFSDDDDQFGDRRHGGKPLQRAEQDRHARKLQEHLVLSRLHAPSCTRRRKNHGNHKASLHILLYKRAADKSHDLSAALLFHQCLGFAKIMRPAAVCSADVTSTSIVLLIWRRPFSMTIIVPSSR